MSKHMSEKQKENREKIVKGMKKGDGEKFEKRYPGRGKEVMYATATKQAMEEDVVAFYKKQLIESLIQENEQPRQRPPNPFVEKINSLELSPEHREKALQILNAYENAFTGERSYYMDQLANHLGSSGVPSDHPLIGEIKKRIADLEDTNRQKDLGRAGRLF